jgi:hypothetical protein
MSESEWRQTLLNKLIVIVEYVKSNVQFSFGSFHNK